MACGRRSPSIDLFVFLRRIRAVRVVWAGSGMRVLVTDVLARHIEQGSPGACPLEGEAVQVGDVAIFEGLGTAKYAEAYAAGPIGPLLRSLSRAGIYVD
eukprot:3062244-Alexandrium_andersonii.AAC.1